MRRVARGLLIVVSILNGVAGLVCGVLFIAGPDGHFLQAGALLPVVQGLPLASVFFRDFVWIGVAMLLVLGVPNSIAAVMLLRKSENQYLATLVAGVLLLLWCGFEFVFMFNALAVGYFVVGLISILSPIVLLRPAPASA
jgi:EamA domain-containing membrane protein RarD